MKKLQEFRQAICYSWTDWQRRRKAEYRKRLERKSKKVVQICERNGVVYVSYNGYPLIAATELKGNLLLQVKTMRWHYVNNVLEHKKFWL